MQYRGNETPSRRNRHTDRASRPRSASRRTGGLSSLRQADRPAQHHADPLAGKMPGAQPAGKRMAIHARKLALEPDLQILPRHRRPLLRCLEQAHRSALAHHVARPARLGPWVLIKESWYYAYLLKKQMLRPNLIPIAVMRELGVQSVRWFA